ncbi:long chain acyl-CoA synthetase 2 [Arachis ipaensis]|uniref:long chain acyl-CoA synthetase 2 n=1 Tax=Arachis ipaensis TaxID=130454 RepID=UPI0007AF4525|nr:long chain acyl-CoA synthetase 2 [Arachis ipaensis]
MYTSGTTGDPKGVVIKNEAFMAEVLSIDQIISLTDRVATEEDVYFSFLPLAHVYDQIMETYCIHKNSSIGFWQGDVRFLLEDIQTLKPTIFCGVPRVFDRIYAGINNKVSSGGALQSALFHYAYNYKLRNLEKGLPQHKAAPLFDKLVFDKARGNALEKCTWFKIQDSRRIYLVQVGSWDRRVKAPTPMMSRWETKNMLL